DPRKDPALAGRYGLREGEMAVILERSDGARTALAAVSESELTQGLLRLSRNRGLNAYFLQGHGEPPPQLEGWNPGDRVPLRGLSRSLEQEGYALAPLFLESVPEVPRNADVVIAAGPQTPLSSAELERLSRFLEGGGHLVLFLEPGVTA